MNGEGGAAAAHSDDLVCLWFAIPDEFNARLWRASKVELKLSFATIMISSTTLPTNVLPPAVPKIKSKAGTIFVHCPFHAHKSLQIIPRATSRWELKRTYGGQYFNNTKPLIFYDNFSRSPLRCGVNFKWAKCFAGFECSCCFHSNGVASLLGLMNNYCGFQLLLISRR